MPEALTVKAAPVPVGVWLAGLGVQTGGPVVPAVQLRFTAPAYPFKRRQRAVEGRALARENRLRRIRNRNRIIRSRRCLQVVLPDAPPIRRRPQQLLPAAVE